MSAAAVISPMLITFLGMDPYLAVGIALSSDVLASAVSAYTYGKNKNLDIRNGIIMMLSVLLFTVVGSFLFRQPVSEMPNGPAGPNQSLQWLAGQGWVRLFRRQFVKADGLSGAGTRAVHALDAAAAGMNLRPCFSRHKHPHGT